MRIKIDQGLGNGMAYFYGGDVEFWTRNTSFFRISSLSDLLNPANSFYKLAQIAPPSLSGITYIQVSQHDLVSISKTFCSNLV
jgi:hypothetical protein